MKRPHLRENKGKNQFENFEEGRNSPKLSTTGEPGMDDPTLAL